MLWASTVKVKQSALRVLLRQPKRVPASTHLDRSSCDESCCLQYGKHHIQFLVDGKWRLRADLPQEMSESGKLCNVINVEASESFHVFSNTGWHTATLRSRLLHEDGTPFADVRPRLACVHTSKHVLICAVVNIMSLQQV